MAKFAARARLRVTSRVAAGLLGPGLATMLSLAAATPQILPLTALSTSGYDWLDANILLWDFWWTKHAVASLQNPFWTDLLLYPSGTSLAFHGYPLPYSLFSLAFQQAFVGPTGLVIAFNAAVAFSSVMSGLGVYWLVLRLTGSRAAAVVSATAFVWMPFRSLNVPRLTLMATEGIVWYVLLWVRFVDLPSRGRAIAVGACLALTFYSSPEYAVSCIGLSALWIGWFFIWQNRPPTALTWRRLLLPAVAFVVLASPLLLQQARAISDDRVTPTRPIGEVAAWSPALASFVTPSRIHPLYGSAFAFAGEYGDGRTTGMRSETSISLTIWCLALISLSRLKRDRSAFWALGAGVLLILMLGPVLRITGTWTTGIPLPYALLYAAVPPLRASRDPTRLFPMAMLMLTVLAGFGLRACLAPIRRTAIATGITGTVVALVIFESLTSWPAKVQANALIDPAYAQIVAAQGNFAVLDLSPDQAALAAQTSHGRPITAGTRSVPRSSAAGRVLGVEADFRQAEGVLALEPATLASRLHLDREELDRFRFRFVVVPVGAAAQRELARRIGLREQLGRDRVLYEVPPAR